MSREWNFSISEQRKPLEILIKIGDFWIAENSHRIWVISSEFCYCNLNVFSPIGETMGNRVYWDRKNMVKKSSLVENQYSFNSLKPKTPFYLSPIFNL